MRRTLRQNGGGVDGARGQFAIGPKTEPCDDDVIERRNENVQLLLPIECGVFACLCY